MKKGEETAPRSAVEHDLQKEREGERTEKRKERGGEQRAERGRERRCHSGGGERGISKPTQRPPPSPPPPETLTCWDSSEKGEGVVEREGRRFYYNTISLFSKTAPFQLLFIMFCLDYTLQHCMKVSSA